MLKEKELIILAIYLNVDGMSRQQVDFYLYNIMQTYENMYKDVNKDVKIYWFPVSGKQETKVDCIYPPAPIMNGNIENELLKIYKLLVNSKNDEAKDLIIHIDRRLKLYKLNKKDENK